MENEIKNRTKKIGINIIKPIDSLPRSPAIFVIANQVIKSSTSIGANYRAACRAKSGPDFINKLKIVEEEADETLFWIEILEDSTLIKPEMSVFIKKELNENISIV